MGIFHRLESRIPAEFYPSINQQNLYANIDTLTTHRVNYQSWLIIQVLAVAHCYGGNPIPFMRLISGRNPPQTNELPSGEGIEGTAGELTWYRRTWLGVEPDNRRYYSHGGGIASRHIIRRLTACPRPTLRRKEVTRRFRQSRTGGYPGSIARGRPEYIFSFRLKEWDIKGR